MPLRFAYICADRGVPIVGNGGSSTHVRGLVRGLIARGHSVDVFAACPGEARGTRDALSLVDLATDDVLNEVRVRVAKQLREGGAAPIIAAELYGLLLNQTLLRELEQRDASFDVVYERQSLWSFAGLQFARRAKIPYVLEVNAPLTEQQQAYRHLGLQATAAALEEMLLSSADRVVLTSPALRDYARARGASQRRLRVVPCGVAPSFFSGRPRPPRAGAGPFVIGFIGSLKPWHGLDLLVEAFAQLARRDPDYRLLIVGDGPLRNYSEAEYRRRGLGDRVTFAGAVEYDRIPEYLARMDVGVAPYPAMEAFYFSPLKVWEYAAAGVPIVASASGELPRLFPHKTAALLHPPGSVRKLINHIERLRADPILAQRLARRARGVAKQHTWDRLAARVETLVQRVRGGAHADAG